MAKTFRNIRDDSGGGGGAVDSVNGQTGDVILGKGDVGLSNVDNTSDVNKPVSSAQQTALNGKENTGVAATLISQKGKLIYIDRTRTDSYTESGSFGFPYKTIQGAIDFAASVGDGGSVPYSFIIATGTYDEQVNLNNKGLFSVTIKSLGRVAINPATGNALISNSDNSNLQDLVVESIEFSKPVVLLGDGTTNQFKTTEFRDCSFTGTATLNINRLNNFALKDVYAETAFTVTNVNFMFFNGGQIQSTFTYTMDSTLPQPANGVIGGINLLSMMMNGVSLTVGGSAVMNFVPHSSRIGTTAGAFTIPAGCIFTAYNTTLRGNWTNNGTLTLRNSHSENDIAGTEPVFTANKSTQTGYTPANSTDYLVVPNKVNSALDELAERVTDFSTSKQDSISASNNQVVYQNGSGVIEGFPDFFKEGTHGGIAFSSNRNPDDNAGGINLHNFNLNLDPDQNSPDEKWTLHNNSINLDVNDSGFQIGTNGQATTVINNNINHTGTGDSGEINFITNYFNLGDSVNPIDVRGFSYSYGFGNINAGVNIDGAIQGYGFQPQFDVAATIEPSSYIVGFYDFATFPSTPNYTSFAAGPTIDEIKNNNNYQGLSINPTIDDFIGNAGFFGVNIGPNLGEMAPNGSCIMVNVNPTVDMVYQTAQGINVTMDNVTVYAGAVSSLNFQDLTLTFNSPGDNNSFTLEYTSGGTAGSEVVGISGNNISVQIESGVSTANQIKTALEAISQLAAAITVTVSGIGANPQITGGPSSFTGGANPGNKKAAYLDGDVEITGALTFGGALSIGQLNAFGQTNMVNGTGNPVSTHSLITNPIVGNNETITLGDYLGINTAMLLQVGTNSSVSTGFVGMTALGLPAVVNMSSGSSVDLVGGAVFALSLDAGATGGTIDQLTLCRSISIPNGVTSVTRQYGYHFDLPFGDPATTSWGFYEQPGKNNYFAGNLLIGGTPISDDIVTNTSVALEIKSVTKAFLNARMNSTERDALTAVNGMQIYNTSTNKLQVYATGSWVDLH